MKEDVEKIHGAMMDYVVVLEKAIVAAKTFNSCMEDRKKAKRVYDSIVAEVKKNRQQQVDEIREYLKRGNLEPYTEFKREYEFIHDIRFRIFNKENDLTLQQSHPSDITIMREADILEILDDLTMV